MIPGRTLLRARSRGARLALGTAAVLGLALALAPGELVPPPAPGRRRGLRRSVPPPSLARARLAQPRGLPAGCGGRAPGAWRARRGWPWSRWTAAPLLLGFGAGPVRLLDRPRDRAAGPPLGRAHRRAALIPLRDPRQRSRTARPSCSSLIGLLALLPAALVMLTSFLKIAVVLSIARSALGAPQVPPSTAVTGLALVAHHAGDGSGGPPHRRPAPRRRRRARGLAESLAMLERASGPLREFLARFARPDDRAAFLEVARRLSPPGGGPARARTTWRCSPRPS